MAKKDKPRKLTKKERKELEARAARGFPEPPTAPRAPEDDAGLRDGARGVGRRRELDLAVLERGPELVERAPRPGWF